MYYQQQNKSYPQRCLLANSEVTHSYSILTVLNLHAHTNFWLVCAFPFFL